MRETAHEQLATLPVYCHSGEAMRGPPNFSQPGEGPSMLHVLLEEETIQYCLGLTCEDISIMIHNFVFVLGKIAPLDVWERCNVFNSVLVQL